MTAKKVVMSGMRSTGKLHLGNYWGALKNWVELQDRYECYFMVADWHMFTTGYDDTRALQDNVREMALDWLAAGLDPKRCTIFLQSKVPQHAELALLLSMVTPLSWLENNPTWKEQLQELARTKESKMREQVQEIVAATGPHTSPLPQAGEGARGEVPRTELRTHGFLGYPVLQAADILAYGGGLVPVGKDQEAHVELSREIARRFNSIYGPVLTEPKPLFTPTPKVSGIDGRKMSKSYGNAIDIFETPESLSSKVMSMYTDPKKARAKDPGHPEPCLENPPGCAVFALHKLYSEYWPRREKECRAGEIGCVACKKDLLKSLEGPFAGFRQAREKFSADAGRADEMLAAGSRKAREVAERTLENVRKAMHLR